MYHALLWYVCDKADSNDSQVRRTATVTTNAMTASHERSVDVTRWQPSDIAVWLDTNHLTHLKHWYATVLPRRLIGNSLITVICPMHYHHWTDYKVTLSVCQSVSQ